MNDNKLKRINGPEQILITKKVEFWNWSNQQLFKTLENFEVSVHSMSYK